MRIIIRGKEYERVGMDTCAPLHMIELQQQSKRLVDGGGLSTSKLRRIDREGRDYARARKRWVDDVEAWRAAGADPDLEPEEPDEPDNLFVSIAMLVFLSIRGAGEPITFEAAASIPLGAIAFAADPGDPDPADELDDDEGDDDADPSSPATGGPVTSAAGASPVAETETTTNRGPSSGPATP